MSVEQFLTDKERIRALEECLSCIFTAVLWRDGDAVQGERDQIWLRDQAIAIAEEATKYAAETPSDHRVFALRGPTLRASVSGASPARACWKNCSPKSKTRPQEAPDDHRHHAPRPPTEGRLAPR